MAQKPTISQQIDELTQWVQDHNGDVSFDAFRQACDRIAYDLLKDGPGGVSERLPRGVQGQGLVTLDFVCARIRTYVPAELLGYNLPGVEAFDEEIEYNDHVSGRAERQND
jgi:hypothetical protein